MKEQSSLKNAYDLLGRKDRICISIIVPVHSLSPDRRVDPLTVRKAMEEAAESMRFRFTRKETEPLVQALEELYQQIDFQHNTGGIGMYVSPGFRRLVRFGNPVRKKVQVSDSFEIRDWLFETYEAVPYWMLAIDGRGARLYKCVRNTITEITDQYFPLKYEEEYEYNPPSRGSSYVGNAFVKEFEKDKPELQSRHYRNFLHQVDGSLEHYEIKTQKLVIAGDGKELDLFRKLTRQKNIAGWLRGNYLNKGVETLAQKSWELMKVELDAQRNKLVMDCLDRVGQGSAITGMEEIWKAAHEGRGSVLVLDKDYARPGFLVKENGNQLYLHPPAVPHQVVQDAVDVIMQEVLEKNGEVVMVENGAMEPWHIALMTRY